MKYGERFNVGYGCRFDLLNTEKETLFIGDNCEIGDYCHFVAIEDVHIGNNFLCASKVFISDTSHGKYSGRDCSMPEIPPGERKLIGNPITIGNNVWCGDNVVILGGCNIGDGVIIGANSVVTHDIPAECIVAGAPARVLKKYDRKEQQWISIQ